MIIATAGHVDHGKTSLVRALTGQETDRTAEERQRGMSIDLGFAHLPTPNGIGIDLVDVPGHERFMRTLMVGVGAVDAVMLVVAADEGVMPQTLEHIELISLLGIDRVVVVLTKIFRSPAQARASLSTQLRVLIAESGPEHVEVVEVDSVTGLGIDVLRRVLLNMTQHPQQPQHRLLERFWVDRHFHRPGAAHVVTGTLYQGRITPGQTLRLTPSGAELKVRFIQRHGRTVEALSAGQRGALDLGGPVNDEDIERGSQLLSADAWLMTRRFDARIDKQTGASWRGDLQVHLAGATVSARQVPLRDVESDPGHTYSQWILDVPLACRFGDRFIVRNATSRSLVASGMVIDPQAPTRGRQRPDRLAALKAMDQANPAAAMGALFDTLPDGLDLHGFARSRHLPRTELGAAISEVSQIEPVFHRRGWACWERQLLAWKTSIKDEVCRWHLQQPERRGPTLAALARTLAVPSDSRLLGFAIRDLLDSGDLRQSGPCLHQPGHSPQPGAASEALFRRMAPLFRICAPRPPVIGELLDTLQIERDALQTALDELTAVGALVFVGRNRYLLPESADTLYRAAAELAQRSPDASFSAADFRDHTGIGRNHSVAVLEYLDRSGLTRLRNARRWLVGPGAP